MKWLLNLEGDVNTRSTRTNLPTYTESRSLTPGLVFEVLVLRAMSERLRSVKCNAFQRCCVA